MLYFLLGTFIYFTIGFVIFVVKDDPQKPYRDERPFHLLVFWLPMLLFIILFSPILFYEWMHGNLDN